WPKRAGDPSPGIRLRQVAYLMSVSATRWLTHGDAGRGGLVLDPGATARRPGDPEMRDSPHERGSRARRSPLRCDGLRRAARRRVTRPARARRRAPAAT